MGKCKLLDHKGILDLDGTQVRGPLGNDGKWHRILDKYKKAVRNQGYGNN